MGIRGSSMCCCYSTRKKARGSDPQGTTSLKDSLSLKTISVAHVLNPLQEVPCMEEDLAVVVALDLGKEDPVLLSLEFKEKHQQQQQLHQQQLQQQLHQQLQQGKDLESLQGMPQSHANDVLDTTSNYILTYLNKASKACLQDLPGVGKVTAAQIIAQRPFRNEQDLLQVKGIGVKKKAQILLHLKTCAHALNSSTGNQWRKNDLVEQFADIAARQQSEHFSTSHQHEIARSKNHGAKKPQYTEDRVASLFQGRAPTLLLATWNIRNLSSKRRACLRKISETIEEFDVVALQEVRDERVLKQLRILLPGWQYIISNPVGSSSTHTESYAFFYRKAKVALRGEPCLIKDFENHFVREPFVAQFSGINPLSRQECLAFVLVNIHIVFGTPQDRLDEMTRLGELIRAIDAYCAEHPNVILLGDFNMAPSDCSLEGRFPLISQPFHTTIYGNLYDNIWLKTSEATGKEWTACSGIHRVDWRYYQDTKATKGKKTSLDALTAAKKQCNRELSDHLPVWTAFSLENTLGWKVETLRLSEFVLG